MGKNFLNREQIYQLIAFIPDLSCYKPKANARKPLDVESLDLLTKIVYEAALRIDEGTGLRVKDIDFEFDEIILPYTKTGRKWCKCAITKKIGPMNKVILVARDPNCKICKGIGKIRINQHAWVPKWLMTEIKSFIERKKLTSKCYLFESPSFPGQYISYSWCWKTYKELGDIAGFEILARYTLRKTKGIYTHFFRKCKAKQMYFIDKFTLTEIAKKLRHTGDLRSLLTYIEADEEDLREKERAVYG